MAAEKIVSGRCGQLEGNRVALHRHRQAEREYDLTGRLELKYGRLNGWAAPKEVEKRLAKEQEQTMLLHEEVGEEE